MTDPPSDRADSTVACLPSEDVVVLASSTPWRVPWELMMLGPFVSCGLIDGEAIRHLTVPTMVASAVRRGSTSGAVLVAGDFPPLPVFAMEMPLLDAAASVVETGWDLAVVMAREPRLITARSVYRALVGTDFAHGAALAAGSRSGPPTTSASPASAPDDAVVAAADGDLRRRIEHELLWDPSIAPASVRVHVEDLTVTLVGTVGSYSSRLAAVRAARRVVGVTAVVDELVVEPLVRSGRTDIDITAFAEQAMQWSVSVPDSVRATVLDGVLTLGGTVDWNYQRRAAEHAVEHVVGVRDVVTAIELRSAAAHDRVVPHR